MRRSPVFLLFLALAAGCVPATETAPPARGTLSFDTVRSGALAGNPLGDSPAREAVVYLPPGYEEAPRRRFPVVYLLHGFDGDGRQFLGPPFSLPAALDSLIGAGAIRPMIVVMPDGKNHFGGSFFANSPATGRWGDFVAEEVVAHVDGEYRTLRGPEGRGIAGWSMGGFGALALGMSRPDRFGAVYALSPCCLGPELLEDYGPAHPAWRELLAAGSAEDAARMDFHARLLLAVAAVLSPGAGRSPLRVDLPFAPSPRGPLPSEPGLSRWREATPEARVAGHLEALRSLRGIGLDAGTQDGFEHIPAAARRFSEALAAAGVPHRFEEYRGTHGSRVPERLRRVVLPFFSERLDDPKPAAQAPGG